MGRVRMHYTRVTINLVRVRKTRDEVTEGMSVLVVSHCNIYNFVKRPVHDK